MSSSVPSWCVPQRLAYVVSHAYPYSSNGYAVRTHEVARALAQSGQEVLVISRPGRPWDIDGFPAHRYVPPEQVIDGVRYIVLPAAPEGGSGFRDRMRGVERVLMGAFRVFRPAVVMAASNWHTAEPALYAARRWGVPFFYEKRGFWEMSRAATEPDYALTEDYARDQSNELRIAQRAQAVFTLNGSMRQELVRQGLPADRIHLVPNGVSVPAPQRDGEISRRGIGCTARHLLGYFGSFNAYEGGEDLIRLLARLRGDGVDVAMMIVGSEAPQGMVGGRQGGAVEASLRALAAQLGVAGHLHVVPRVPQNQIGAYYRLSDAMIMPRRRHPVTEMVAPIKPYCAASHGVPVFMTDMPPLNEIAAEIHAVLFPEGDIETLAAQVRRLLENGDHPALRNRIDPSVSWAQRVRPMSRLLARAAASAPTLSVSQSGGTAGAGTVAGFDLASVPQAALQAMHRSGPVAVVGPCRQIAGQGMVRLTRANILAELATGAVGRLVVDWPGLQEEPGEWDGLWSIGNMRLNRQMMDACRIAVARGWQLQVIGTVHRAQAPLYRTVSALFEELPAEEQGVFQEAAQ